MRVLYIGHYGHGSTTRMRGECLENILQPEEFFVINTDIPIYNTPRLARSFGWRYYHGPLISNVNNYILQQLKGKGIFDLVWIDKGVFIEPGLLEQLKVGTTRIIHYTPDTAFFYNRSRLFYRCISLYDYCITTKSFELEDYKKSGAHNTIFCFQGFDKKIHYPRNSFQEKEGIVFIGLNEPWREEVINLILSNKLNVKIAGEGWERYSHRNRHNKFLTYHGKGVFGDEYAKLISSSLIGLGLLSKKFPEKHTTRTIEIPACGTALIAEDNEEVRQIFSDGEVFYFDSLDSLASIIPTFYNDREFVRRISELGLKRIRSQRFGYNEILEDLLRKMNIVSDAQSAGFSS